MRTILFHSNILSKEDVPFLNAIYKNLIDKNFELVLIGWNQVPNDWGLLPNYLDLPDDIYLFNPIYELTSIKNEFKKYNLSVDFLLDRFGWWFPEYKNQLQQEKRLAFLHYHLHLYIQFIEKYNPSLLLIWNGNEPRHCILKALGEFYGIKMMFLERGPLPSVLFYDLKGVLFHSSVASLPINEFKNKNTNNLLLRQYKIWYQDSLETLWEQPQGVNVNLRDKFKIHPNQKITLFVGQIDNDIQTKLFSPYFSTNLEAFKWFLENGRSDEYFVIGKHHPKSQLTVEFYQNSLNDQSNVVWTDEIPLDECLKQVDNVVAVNSSVIFDALLYQKPVLTLGKTMLDNKNILYEYQPEAKIEIFKSFYKSYNFEIKIENFNSLLGFMLNKNLLFTKDFDYALRYSDFLKKIAKDVKKLENTIISKNVTNKYENTIIINEPSRQNLVQKIKKSIKLFVKNILKST